MNTVLGSELTTKLAGIRSELCLHRDTAASLVSEIDKVLGNGTEDAQTPISTPSGPSGPDQDQSKRMGIIQQALELLRMGEFTTPELLKELARRGHQVKGKRPIQTLYGILHKDMKSSNPRVMRSKDGLWQAIRSN